jgi:hypothetical protein
MRRTGLHEAYWPVSNPPGEGVRRGRRGLLEGIPVAAIEPREFWSDLFL